MAIIHQATLVPSKLELLEQGLLLPGPLTRIGAARLDDPEGEVGVELLVVRTGSGQLFHAPLTYRGVPLEGAEDRLVGTMQHSVLGIRYVYDAVADPVFVAAVVEVIRTGGREAPEFVETPQGPVRRDPLMSLRGSGSQAPGGTLAEVIQVGDSSVITTEGELTVNRYLASGEPGGGGLTLTATGEGLPGPIVLAVLV